MGTAFLIDIEAVCDESFAIHGDLGLGGGEDFGGHLHAEVFIEGCEGEITRGTLNDMFSSEEGCLVERLDAEGGIGTIKEFWDHS